MQHPGSWFKVNPDVGVLLEDKAEHIFDRAEYLPLFKSIEISIKLVVSLEHILDETEDEASEGAPFMLEPFCS